MNDTGKDWPAIRHNLPDTNATRLQTLQFASRPVRLTASPRLFLENCYYRQGHAGTSAHMYLRDAVAQQLQDVLNHLPSHYGLWIFDAWRSRETQAALFDHIATCLHRQHPQWDEAHLQAQVRRFVAHPQDTSRFPVMPHLSGGAVDLAIFECGSGCLLDFGTEFDCAESASQTAYFEQDHGTDPRYDEARWQTVRQNRRMLVKLMQSAGFSNYPDEWWHYDLGDCLWAEACGSQWFYPAMSPADNV